MEAKDTVMSSGKLCRLVCLEYRTATLEGKPCDGEDCEVCQLTKQAEIAFKAGQEEEYKKWIKACMKAGMLISKPDQLVNLHKAGIREVVDWIENNNYYIDRRDTIEINNRDWDDQLKEWGI